MEYELVENEDVYTLKNQNTTIGFVRFNEREEVKYIFVNPLFWRKKTEKRLVFQPLISPLGEKLLISIKDFN